MFRFRFLKCQTQLAYARFIHVILLLKFVSICFQSVVGLDTTKYYNMLIFFFLHLKVLLKKSKGHWLSQPTCKDLSFDLVATFHRYDISSQCIKTHLMNNGVVMTLN